MNLPTPLRRRLLAACLVAAGAAILATAATGTAEPTAAAPPAGGSAPLRDCTVLAAPDRAARILLVRHAEAEAGGTDPELTPAGRRRAEALADLLATEPLTAILATDTRRARATAAPAAARHGLEVQLYDPRRLADLAGGLLQRGGTILVVGHSNTTPELVRLLGGDPGAPIGHDEHDRLYRVDGASGETTLERFEAADDPRGAESPPPLGSLTS